MGFIGEQTGLSGYFWIAGANCLAVAIRWDILTGGPTKPQARSHRGRSA